MACRCVAVDCVLINKGRVVLVERKNEPFKGMMALPGGFVESGETLEEAIKREVMEETGLEPTILKMIGVFDSPSRDPRQVVSVAFLGLAFGEPSAGDDAKSVIEIAIPEAIKADMAFDHSAILRKGLEALYETGFYVEKSSRHRLSPFQDPLEFGNPIGWLIDEGIVLVLK